MMKISPLAFSVLAGASSLMLFPNISDAAVLSEGSSLVINGTPTFIPATPSNPVDFTTLTGISFGSTSIDSPAGDFATGSFASPNPTLSNVNLSYTGTGTIPPSIAYYTYDASVSSNPFIDFGNFTLGSETSPLTFVATPPSFNFTILGTPGNFSSSSSPITGEFFFGDTSLGEGNLSVSRSVAANSFQMIVSVGQSASVPEPSAILGLAAILGLGALTKKANQEA